ncbi:MAG: hypothetical protein DRJ45_02315, partial [Thermoprotei archaeon]
HTKEPVPFAIYDSRTNKNAKERRGFDEKSASAGELGVVDALNLMNMLLIEGGIYKQNQERE